MTLNPFKLIKAVSAILKFNKEVSNIMTEAKTDVIVEGEHKAGWKTTEFWLGVIGVLSTVGAAVAPMMPASALVYIASVSAVVPSVYIVARTIAKQTKTVKDDAFLEALAIKLKPILKLEEPK